MAATPLAELADDMGMDVGDLAVIAGYYGHRDGDRLSPDLAGWLRGYFDQQLVRNPHVASLYGYAPVDDVEEPPAGLGNHRPTRATFDHRRR